MKTPNRVIQWLILMLVALGSLSIAVPKALSQCPFGPLQIVCHSATTNINNVCCVWWTCGSPPQPCCLIAGTETITTTTGWAVTCGTGSKAVSTSPFNGTCAWDEYGSSTCAGVAPWGPIARTGSTPLQSCIGNCPG